MIEPTRPGSSDRSPHGPDGTSVDGPDEVRSAPPRAPVPLWRRLPFAPRSARVAAWWAVALLVVSAGVRIGWAIIGPNGMNVVDLHVYVDGAASVTTGRLYEFTYSENSPDFALPFTYPPFAALVFFPLHYIPFRALTIAWLVLTVVALWWVLRIAIELVVGREAARTAAWTAVVTAWTAVGIWTEPVRVTMDYGQVNVFLVLGGMIAVRSARWWISGPLVGILAGIKLTPAVTGLYFLARRRWRAAIASAVTFAATVAASWIVLGDQARFYFTSLFGDAERIGPVGSVWNQSLRGAVERFDLPAPSIVWIVAVAACAVAAWWAWRSLGPDDRLGTIVIVSLLGLLVSPISWLHHWVWMLPMLVWLVYGPLADRAGTRAVAVVSGLATVVGIPWLLGLTQDSMWDGGHPLVVSVLATANVVGVLVLYAWMIANPAHDSPRSRRAAGA